MEGRSAFVCGGGSLRLLRTNRLGSGAVCGRRWLEREWNGTRVERIGARVNARRDPSPPPPPPRRTSKRDSLRRQSPSRSSSSSSSSTSSSSSQGRGSGSSTPWLSKVLSFLMRQLLLEMPNSRFEKLDVDVAAGSSWELLQGRCQGVRVTSSSFSFAGIQAQSLDLLTDKVVITPPDFLRGRAPIMQDDVCFTADFNLKSSDLTQGVFVRDLLRDMITELIRTSVSGAMGRWIPKVVAGIDLTLRSMELQEGKLLVLATLSLPDSAIDLKIRTSFRTAEAGRIVSLDNPELLVREPFLGNILTIPFANVAMVGIDLGDDVSVESIAILKNNLQIRIRAKLRKDRLILSPSSSSKSSLPPASRRSRR